ncbi:MAG: hypothetical protein R2733_14100 [Acidimicrobiales bacterium]
MAEHRFVHGTARFREVILGGIVAFVGLQFLLAATTRSNSPTLWLIGVALIGIGAAVISRGRRLGLLIDGDRVMVRRFLFTLPFEKELCRLVIDDDQPQWSIAKFAVLEVDDGERQTIGQISWTGQWSTAPRLRELLNDIEAAGLTIDRRSA